METVEDTKQIKISVPAPAKELMRILLEDRHQSFMVGGCVRDIILGKEPQNYDMLVSCSEQTLDRLCEENYTKIAKDDNLNLHVFKDKDGNIFQICLFNLETEKIYTLEPGHIDPIKENLLGRDFTINALAVDINGNLLDYFGGYNHLTFGPKPFISCIGEAKNVLKLDPLRIFRAYRFASQLNGNIAIRNEAISISLDGIKNIEPEKIRDELNKYLLGECPGKYIKEILTALAIRNDKYLEYFIMQRNPHHKHQFLPDHVADVVANTQKDLVTRLAALFHDIGKKSASVVDYNDATIRHYPDHPKMSAEITEELLKELKYPDDIIAQVKFLVLHHDDVIGYNKIEIKEFLHTLESSGLPLDLFDKWIDLAYSDYLDHYDLPEFKKDEYKKLKDEIINGRECFSIRDLAITGNDLLSLGITGKDIAQTLSLCIDCVIKGTVQNTKEELLEYIKYCIIF